MFPEGKDSHSALNEIIRQRHLDLSLEDAMQEILATLNEEEVASWLQSYIARAEKQQRAQDKLGVVIDGIVRKLWQDAYTKTDWYSEYFAPARERVSRHQEKLQNDTEFFKRTWGLKWHDNLTLGLPLRTEL
jgi:hypothetical protein